MVIDPGHGGAIVRRKDDKWDPVTEKYLNYYSTGMMYKGHKEYEIMLDLAKRVNHYLELTATEEGWKDFEGILSRFSTNKQFKRIEIQPHLTRDFNWHDRFDSADDPEVNADFRLYDYPADPKKGSPMIPGRISYINSKKPYLVVSLHMTPAGRGNPGGMSAVLTPGYRTFDLIRKIHLDQKPIRDFYRLDWFKHGNWLVTDSGWSKYESARADTWVYFHGYRSVQSGKGPWISKNRGLRHNMVQWRYRDPKGWIKEAKAGGPGPYARKYSEFKAEGPFWDRERSTAEEWRREDGPLGFGGDNHYASDELFRFIQIGARRYHKSLNKRSALGPIQKPYISAYSLPLLTNAIVAYLEVGHLNRSRDRTLVIDHMDTVARSLAAGIYSLFEGMPIDRSNLNSPYTPRGKPLGFEKYEKLPEGNYFKIVSEN